MKRRSENDLIDLVGLPVGIDVTEVGQDEGGLVTVDARASLSSAVSIVPED